MDEELSKTITRMFKDYYENYNRLSAREREERRERIIAKILELVYFWPQKFFRLDEEDSAEFMLAFEGRIKGLFDSYNVDCGDFGSYIFPVLEKNVKGFRIFKHKKQTQEDSVLMGCTAYEYLLREQENSVENQVVAEYDALYGQEELPYIKRMKEIFNRVPLARERFFVFVVAHSNMFSSDAIKSFCHSFNINTDETFEIIGYINRHRKTGREDINHAIEKRNEYFGKKLYLENELARFNYLSDHSHDDDLNSEIDKIISYYESKNKYINSCGAVAPRKIVSLLFHKSYGSIGSYLTYTYKLILWCKNLQGQLSDFGVSRKNMDEIRKINTNLNKIQIALDRLNPIEDFRINIPLNT